MFLCELAADSGKLVGEELLLRGCPVSRLQRLSAESWHVLLRLLSVKIRWWSSQSLINLGSYCLLSIVHLTWWLSQFELRSILEELFRVIYLRGKWSLVFIDFFIFENKSIFSRLWSCMWNGGVTYKILSHIACGDLGEHRGEHRALDAILIISDADLWRWLFPSSLNASYIISAVGKSTFRTLLILYNLLGVTSVTWYPILRMFIPFQWPHFFILIEMSKLKIKPFRRSNFQFILVRRQADGAPSININMRDPLTPRIHQKLRLYVHYLIAFEWKFRLLKIHLFFRNDFLDPRRQILL